MSFSFGFAVGNEGQGTPPSGDEAQHEFSPVEEPSAGATLSLQSRDHLDRFRWIENVVDLLDQRRKEQIIYDDIDLQKPHSVASVLGSDDQSGFRNELRAVDLSRSSFAKSPVKHIAGESLSSNDLIPGVYEGGLKVWESSMDLVHYMNENPEEALPLWKLEQSTTPRDDEPMRFVELGCGHGLPSCYILRQAAHLGLLDQVRLCLLDYNDFVIKDALVSNIVLNTADTETVAMLADLAKCLKIGSGDWFGLLDDDGIINHSLIHKVDWIAAAETLYTVEAAKETAYLLSRLLRPETGQAWVASKRYYFGVGGGVDAFRAAAQFINVVVPGSDIKYVLHVETVKVVDNGKANIRELLRVCLKQP